MASRPAVHTRLYQDFYARQASRNSLTRSSDEDPRPLRSVLSPSAKAKQSPTVTLEIERPEPPSVRPETTKDTRFKPYFPGDRNEELRASESEGERKAAPLTCKEVSNLFELREEASLTSRSAPKILRKVDPPQLAYKPKFGVSQLRKQPKPMIGKYYSQLTPVERTISYSSGCNVQKIIKTGKEMISYSDPKAMFAALSQPH